MMNIEPKKKRQMAHNNIHLEPQVESLRYIVVPTIAGTGETVARVLVSFIEIMHDIIPVLGDCLS